MRSADQKRLSGDSWKEWSRRFERIKRDPFALDWFRCADEASGAKDIPAKAPLEAKDTGVNLSVEAPQQSVGADAAVQTSAAPVETGGADAMQIQG